MTEILIITAVSSVLGTLTFGYLVWLGLGLRKALSQSARSLTEIDNIYRMINENDREVYNRLGKTADKLHEEIYNLRKELDRRFDKVYQKLYTEFPQLSDVNEVEPATDN
jgi:hypothetical protein